MCVIDRTIYIKPNGEEEVFEQTRFCSLRHGRKPCEEPYTQTRRIQVQDPGSPSHSIASPSSISNPGTPQIREVRPNPVVVDSRGASDKDTRRQSNRLSTDIVIQFGKSKGKGKEREKRYNRRSADSTRTSGSESAYYAEPKSPREPRLGGSPLGSLPRASYAGTAAYAGSAYAQTQTQTPPPPPPPLRKPPVSAYYPDSPPSEHRRRQTRVVVHHEEGTAPEVLDRANDRERRRAEDKQKREDDRRREETEKITRANIAQEEDDRKERDRANFRENQRQNDRVARDRKRREDEAREDALKREEASRRSRRESDARANERATLRSLEQEPRRTTRTRRESNSTRRLSLRPEQRPDVQQLRATMEHERIQRQEDERIEALEQQHRERYDPRYGAAFQPPLNPSLRHETRNVGVDYGNTYAGPSTTTTYHQADRPRIREVVPGPPDLHERGQQVLEQARNAGRLQDQMGDLTVEDDVFNEHRPGGLHRRNTSGGGGRASGGRRRNPYFD